MVVVAQRHRPVGYDGEEQHLAHDQAQHHAWEMPGLQACLPTGDGSEDSAADAEKKSRSPSKAKPEWIEQQGGELNWATSEGDGDERRRDRQITTVR
jgi:hypothetical protein